MAYGRHINIVSCINKLQGIESIMQGGRYRGFLFVDLGKTCGHIDPVRWCFDNTSLYTLCYRIRIFDVYSSFGLALTLAELSLPNFKASA